VTTGSPYLDYFGFREDPFSLTPNPEYFFLTKEHELAFEELQRGISERKGIIMMIGEMGTGKTILLRTLKKQLPDNVLVSYQLNPSLGFTSIIKKMMKDFGIPHDSDSRAELISMCHDKLSELGDTGQYGLLILDEAQALNEEVLEDIRILSNIEDERGKFLNVILAGQPELADLISVSTLRSLKHRIGIRIYLKPMDTEEILLYLNHRLKVADWSSSEQLFTKDALTWITYSSNGNPRLINVISDNALHRAYRERLRSVDKKIIKRTLAALEGREPLGKAKPRTFSLKGMNPIVMATLVFVVVVAVLLPGRISKWMDKKAAKRANITAVQDTTLITTDAPGISTPDLTVDEDVEGVETVEVIESELPEPIQEQQVSERKNGESEVILEDESPVEPVAASVEEQGLTEQEESTEQEGLTEQAGSTDVDEPPGETVEVETVEVSADSVAGEPVILVDTIPEAKDKKFYEGWTVIVKRGEWIYLIVEREYGYASWDMVERVVEVNEKVNNPNRVYPGQKIYLPPRSEFE